MPKASSHIPVVTWSEGRMPGVNDPRGHGAGVRILTTATALFARFGYNGVSTRDIASAAQVNEVTVYRHFPRKHDLYVAVLESELQQVHFRGDLLAGIAEAPDGRTALARTFELLTNTLMQKPEILRLLQYSVLELNENFDPLVRRHLGELVEVLARYLEPWVKRAELPCADAKTVVLILIGIVISQDSLQRVFRGERLSPDRIFGVYERFTKLEQAAPVQPGTGHQSLHAAPCEAGAE